MQRRRSRRVDDERRKERRDWGAVKMQQTRRGGRKKGEGGRGAKKKKKKESRNGRGNGLQTFPLTLKRTHHRDISSSFAGETRDSWLVNAWKSRKNRPTRRYHGSRNRVEVKKVVCDRWRGTIWWFFYHFFRGILISRSEKYWKGVRSSV